MWETNVIFYEDEIEADLISQFVEIRARYPHKDILEITTYIFRNLRDPILRSGQAAIKWNQDIEISERIRTFSLVGNDSDEIANKKEKLKVLEGIYKDSGVSAKDRIAAINLHAQMQGEIIKAIEQTNHDKRVPPQIILSPGNFHAD